MTHGVAGEYVDAMAIVDLPPDSQKSIFIGTTRVLLCHAGKTLFALEDKCTHAFQQLLGGEIEDGTITCPKHGACFDLASGKPVNRVSSRPVKVYQLRVRNERIEIDLMPLTA